MQEELENNEETQQVEETTQVEETVSTVDESKFESAGDDSVIKIDLGQPVEEPTEEKIVEPVAEEATEEVEAPVLEEITEEEVEEVVEQVEEAVAEAEATGKPLPENIQKLVDFIEDTGGDINDYARLNQDYSQMDNTKALEEYYKLTKPHLDAEEREFLMDENFSFDEDIDDERDIRRKKIALKEQVAEAKAYLDGQKSKYYEEIKAGSKLTGEQQKAVDFFNRYNKESKETQQVVRRNGDVFEKKTSNLFNDKFKGFEYKVGDKKYRFNVKDVDGVKTNQSDLNNFTSKFVDENNSLSDAAGYHKALYTAMNPDAIANHFYEQGKADALKNSVAKSKNVDMTPRQSHGEINAGGVKFKVLGDNSSDFKFKIKNKK
tara:strand:- start:16 stop:1146 length:1131 start_codon:yes stop_codon:yes gene_type:complete